MFLEITCDEVEPAVGGSPCPQTCISDTSSSLSSSLSSFLSSSHQVRHPTHILKCATCTPRQGHLVPQHAGRSVPQASANGCNILKRIRGVTFSFQRIVSQRHFDVNHLREPSFPAHPCNPSNSQNQGTASFYLGPIQPISIPTCKVHLGRQAFSVAYSSFLGHPA